MRKLKAIKFKMTKKKGFLYFGISGPARIFHLAQTPPYDEAWCHIYEVLVFGFSVLSLTFEHDERKYIKEHFK